MTSSPAAFEIGGAHLGVGQKFAPGAAENDAAGLHDVTTGNNGICGSYLCTAVGGYDGPTGLGTPSGIGAF